MRYEHIYDAKQIMNNEVGTVFACAFAYEIQVGINIDWEEFNCHRSAHYRGSSSANTIVKFEGTSLVEIP